MDEPIVYRPFIDTPYGDAESARAYLHISKNCWTKWRSDDIIFPVAGTRDVFHRDDLDGAHVRAERKYGKRPPDDDQPSGNTIEIDPRQRRKAASKKGHATERSTKELLRQVGSGD